MYIKKLKFSLIFSSYSTLNVGFDPDPVNNSLSVSDKSGSATLYTVQYVQYVQLNNNHFQMFFFSFSASAQPQPQPRLDLSGPLLPASLPSGDPETFALPIFLEEPASAIVSPESNTTRLHCRAAHATRLYFECNGKAAASTNETEGRLAADQDGVKFRAVSLVVKRAQVRNTLEFSCRCIALSAVGRVESRMVIVDTACKFFSLPYPFFPSPHSLFLLSALNFHVPFSAFPLPLFHL